ncbi:hypothetical protein BDY19DRAFT_979197 [Irpex rosettiformis]|uniref:Uncharacterized protein n=1 Tax=Irpex rosettiformis TaxID=378272 RepID=A0ACB8TMX3_9APHY|nr:hypothetical protein BDY19DRAFT_979197 [Irpex rosettiformis]
MLLVLSSLISWALWRVYVGCLLGISDVWLCTRTMSFVADSYPIVIFVLDGHILSVSNGTAMSTLSRCIIVASYYIYV